MGNQSISNNFKQIFRHFTVPSLALKNPLSCIVMHQKQTSELQFVNIKTEKSHCVKNVQIRIQDTGNTGIQENTDQN